MKQPHVFGVTPLWDSERKSLWMLPDYLDGIKAAGGVPVVLPIEMSEEDADGIIEAVRMENKRFVWAVQWHPEYMFKTDKNSLAILSNFIDITKKCQ